MKILVVGRGAREHAISWKIHQSKLVDSIYCATGNSGMEEIAELVNIKAENIQELLKFVKKNKIDITIVGPEVAYYQGIVELFQKEGLKVFGPSKKAFDLEISKAFTKELLCKYNIPTASFGVFSDQDKAFEYLEQNSPPYVIKADGIDAGKGLLIAKDEITARLSVNVILKDHIFGEAGKNIIIEELVAGTPVSIVAFTDGNKILGSTSVVNYQRVYDGDRGPFSGGMGSYSPDPKVDDKLLEEINRDFLVPTINAMKTEGRILKGILYMNLIHTDKGLKVVDFQTRFNDPATQTILPRMKTDLVQIMDAIITEKTENIEIEWDDKYCVSIVMVSGGYPMKYSINKKITGVDSIKTDKNLQVFHARISKAGDNLVTVGGRVLNVVAKGKTLEEARKKAYKNIENIFFTEAHYRKDIAKLEKSEGE